MWESLPAIDELLESIVDALAEAALACWPQWYEDRADVHFGEQKNRESKASDAALARLIARLPGRDRGTTERWVRAAAALCRNDRIPRVRSMVRAIEVRQLTDAITVDGPTVVLALNSDAAFFERLTGLARAAEWLATNSSAQVVLVVTLRLAEAPELDSVSFHRQTIVPRPSAAKHESAGSEITDVSTANTGDSAGDSEAAVGGLSDQADASHGADERAPTADRPAIFITPFHGLPHPNSQGEQIIATLLQNDPELNPRFEFNQPLKTAQNSSFTVDLLWRSGRVVIEIDGYYWHSSEAMFSADRQRDFELLTSGYLVLRLPHAEVLADPVGSIEKIRQVVRLRSNV
jgi:very-short-patch-repair endonuclease